MLEKSGLEIYSVLWEYMFSMFTTNHNQSTLQDNGP